MSVTAFGRGLRFTTTVLVFVKAVLQPVTGLVILLKVNNNELWTKLIGSFNAYNLLAIFATGELLGLEMNENLRLISLLENVSGRFEYFVSKEEKITVIVLIFQKMQF